MISESDSTTLSPTNTTTNISNHHNLNYNSDLHHYPSEKSPTLQNGKIPSATNKSFSAKKRRRFEESIIDGFAIMAFKTWEDLQDELNERTRLNNLNTTNNDCIDNSNNCIISDKKVSSKSKNNSQKTSSTSSSTSSHCESNKAAVIKESKKIKDRSKNIDGHSDMKESKDKHQRNKSSSVDKTTLKKAIEAKELAEKRLCILEEKLKQTLNKNKGSHHHNHHNSKDNQSTKLNSNGNTELHSNRGSVQNRDTHSPIETPNGNNNNSDHSHNQSKSIKSEHYPVSDLHIPNYQQHNNNQPRPNGHFGQDLLRDPSLSNKSDSYLPYHQNPHQMQQDSNPAINSLQMHHERMTSSAKPIQQSQSNTSLNTAQSRLQQSGLYQNKPPGSYPHHPQIGLSPTLHAPQSSHSPPIQAQQVQTHPSSNHPAMQHGQFHHPMLSRPPVQLVSPSMQTPSHLLRSSAGSMNPLHNPVYPHQQSSSMISSMSLGSLPSPYCPPSIYITDTISRQTSIIPPPQSHLNAPGLEPASRFGPASALQAITPYSPSGPAAGPHHPGYYPSLPTERSFIEFARTYTGQGHLGYPNLMGSYPGAPPSAPSPFAAVAAAASASASSAYSWPRAILDHQRAVNRFNTMYQSSTSLPERGFSSYPSARPPMFPAGIYPPPF